MSMSIIDPPCIFPMPCVQSVTIKHGFITHLVLDNCTWIQIVIAVNIGHVVTAPTLQ